MSRELIEFSNLIDEKFEPDNTLTEELWMAIQSWLAPQSVKGISQLAQDITADKMVA
jgi:hypothetical protein